jgi:hypothetical protein
MYINIFTIIDMDLLRSESFRNITVVKYSLLNLSKVFADGSRRLSCYFYFEFYFERH